MLTNINTNKNFTLTKNLKIFFILLAFAFTIFQVITILGLIDSSLIPNSSAAGDSLTHTVVGTYADKNANGTADIGDTVDYQFTITNSGTSNLTAVNPYKGICLPLQPKVILNAGASDSTTFKCSYSITAADITAGKVTNVSGAWSYNPVFAIIYSTDVTTITPLTVVKPIDKLSHTVVGTYNDKNGNGITDVGDTIDYVYTYKNEGTTDLTTVNLKVANCDPETPTAIKAGATATTNCSYFITAADITAGKATNKSTPWAFNPQALIIEGAEAITETPLTVVKPIDKLSHTVVGTYNDKNGNGITDVGDTIDYVYTYKNEGTTDLTTVNLKVANCDPETPTAIKAGATATTNCSYFITAADITAGKATNKSTPWAFNPQALIIEGAEAITETPLTVVKPIDKLSHTVVGTYNDKNGNGITDVGDTIDYQFTITNTGTTDLTAVNPVQGICLPLQPKVALKAGAKDSTTFNCSYLITSSDITAGKVTNTTKTWSYNPAFTIIYSDPIITVTPLTVKPNTTSNDFEVTKAGIYKDTNSNKKTDLGDKIEYTFTIKNTQKTDINTVLVFDSKCQPIGVIPSLAPSASDTSTFKCTYLITATDITNGKVENTAFSTALNSSFALLKSTSNTVVTNLTVTSTTTSGGNSTGGTSGGTGTDNNTNTPTPTTGTNAGTTTSNNSNANNNSSNTSSYSNSSNENTTIQGTARTGGQSNVFSLLGLILLIVTFNLFTVKKKNN
jgi:acyl CoA:acetate/3-ketoacid CoA transferase alpha subunit